MNVTACDVPHLFPLPPPSPATTTFTHGCHRHRRAPWWMPTFGPSWGELVDSTGAQRSRQQRHVTSPQPVDNAPDAANQAANSTTSPPFDTAADTPPSYAMSPPPNDTNNAPQYRHVTAYCHLTKRRWQPVPRHRWKYEQEVMRGVGRGE